MPSWYSTTKMFNRARGLSFYSLDLDLDLDPRSGCECHDFLLGHVNCLLLMNKKSFS